MTDFLLNWVLTAALLTAAVLLLRSLFGGRISARLRYALWALVLARLLVPGQLYTAPVEAPRVLPALAAVEALPTPRHAVPEKEPLANAEAAPPVQILPAPGGEEDAPGNPAGKALSPLALLGVLWLAGGLLTALTILWANLLFARRLRRVRVPLAAAEADCPLPVYTAEGLPSPCLFGLLRPAVYVTPEAAERPDRLRHILTHEATHYRHGDHLWSALRCAALAIHWWNPLVWLAAILSRRDAELACDEGALKALGDGERWAYGNTLLALVTAKPQAGDLLRCATTMAGDKRSLRERVSRIVRAPKRWLWAAVLAAALSVLVCACAFAKTEAPKPDGPLTEEELQIFNNKVFNGDGFNMMNQFLYQAVEAPKDYKQIDLFVLFYNGTGTFEPYTEEERRAVIDAGYGGEDPMVDLIKCPRDQMDAVLQEYLGLGLDETDQWCLDQFTYLEEYDAYYDFHGDTDYPGDVTFTSGEWKDGKVLLYYEGSGFPGISSGQGEMNMVSSGPACVTLEPQRDGGYHFLSNWRADPPATPTVYPAWEPERTIPLDSVAPYEPEAVTVERRTGDVAESLWRTRFEPDEFSGEGFDIEVYRSTDGSLRASVAVSETERDCFLTVSADHSAGWTAEDGAWVFTDLFSQHGVCISYYGQLSEHSYGEINDYYVFTDDGAPSLLLRALGNAVEADLDGDGVQEVTASDGWNTSQLFFLRDGTLYKADLYALIHDAWPEAGYMSHGFWDPEGRYLSMSVEVPLEGTDVTVSGFRTLFYDGENLRIYKDESGYTDHLANGLEALPEDVVAAARDFVKGRYDALAAEGYGVDGSGKYDEGNFGPGNVVWDDWRITGLSGPYYEDVGNLQMEIWNVSYETHTTTPDRVMLAGGSYLGEDGWCMIGYPGCDYLYFRLDKDLNRTYLYSTMENDCSPGSEMFLSDMIRTLTDMGLIDLTELDGETLAKIMRPQSAQFLNTLAERDEAERDEILLFLAGYLANGGEDGRTYYAEFAQELDEGGYRDGELTSGGRAAWNKVKDFVSQFNQSQWLSVEKQIPEMPLPELLEFLSKSDGAFTESAVTELHQRFLSDPAAVLKALAEREDWETLADLLAGTIHRDEDLFPGAIDQAKALPPEALDAEQTAVRDYIVSAYEARRQNP